MAQSAYLKAWRKANPEKRLAQERRHRARHKEQIRERDRLRRARYPDRVKIYTATYHEKYPAVPLLNGARERAKKLGLPCDLTKDDIVIPDVCPVLGIPLVKGVGKLCPASPTLDRIVPERGYVKGNIAVISHRANLLKNNATAAELRAVAKYIEHG